MLGLAATLAACAGPAYYTQAISGHFSLLRSQENISDILARDDTDPALAVKLEQALEIRRFAEDELGLPGNRSYTRYAATGREAVAWNVVAAPEFSLEPKKWCFAVSGCVPYRGYFEKAAAQRFAGRLEESGYDVAVSPAVAYSTLGWFDDPLLDTMLEYSEEQTAAFIFHELAHQQLYVRGDTAFNESYAMFIEEMGVELWLAGTGRADRLPEWRRQRSAALQFNALLRSARARLAEEYRSGRDDAEMRQNKAALFDELKVAYRALVDGPWLGQNRFGSWFRSEPNNARLALVTSYHGGACAFEKLYREAGRELARFQALAAEKAELGKADRRAWLEQACEVIASGPDL
jgi:predicted aminopeptidase